MQALARKYRCLSLFLALRGASRSLGRLEFGSANSIYTHQYDSTTERNLIKEWIGYILRDPWRKSGWDVSRKNAVADRGGWAPWNLVPRVLSYWTEHLKFSVQFQDFFAFYFSTSKTGNSYASVIVVVRGRFKFILLRTIHRTWWIEGVMHERYKSHLLNISSIKGSVWSVHSYYGQLFAAMITLSNWPSPIKLFHWPLPFAFPTIYQSWPDKLPWPWVSEDERSSNDFFNSRFSPNSSTLRMGQGDSRYNRWTAEIPTL